MENFEQELKDLTLQLFDIGALKFGNFKMKVGLNSPVYFDLRVMVSYPPLMDLLANLVWNYYKHLKLESTVLCGVPYTALPVATLVSVKSSLPMLIRRKEPKAYGTMKLIEGKFTPGEECLIIEDVVTSGGSILETANDLKKDGLVVKDAIIMVDREQGGIRNLTDNGIRMHSLLTLSKALNILLENGKLDQKTVDDVRAYISSNQIFPNGDLIPKSRLRMKYEERADVALNPLARRILKLMAEKRTNLCVAVDVPSWSEARKIVESVGDSVAVVKTHCDAMLDWTPACEEELKQLSNQLNFIILEDRKLGDIGNTVKNQCTRIFDWAGGATMHPICGDGSMKGVEEAISEKSEGVPLGVFLVAELSCKENLISAAYTKKTTELAVEYKNIVTGLVAQNPLLPNEPGVVQLTPGVSVPSHLLSTGGDHLGQTYVSPGQAVLEKGGDLIVVGRAITQNPRPNDWWRNGVCEEPRNARLFPNPPDLQSYRRRSPPAMFPIGVPEAAAEIRKTLWDAYLERISSEQ